MIRRSLFIATAGFLLVGLSVGQTLPGGSFASGLGFGGALTVGQDYIAGGTAPVGWPRGTEPAGVVTIYRAGADGQFVEVQEVRGPNSAQGDLFGRSVFATDMMLVVGAPGEGAAHIYTPSGSGLTYRASVSPSGMADGAEFGGAYSRGGLRSSTMAVAARQLAVTSFNAESKTGAVHIFGFDPAMAVGRQVDILRGTEGEGFGHSVAGDGNILVVGAPEANDGHGAAYVYAYDDINKWQSIGTITAESDRPAGVGRSVAVSGGTIYVGAASLGSGAVLRAMVHDGMLHTMAPITEGPVAEGTRAAYRFGGTIAADGARLLVSGGGRVFVYEDGTLATTIESTGERNQVSFGTSLALRGDLVAVGSPGAEDEAGTATAFVGGADGTFTEAGLLAAELTYLSAVTGEDVRCEEGQAAHFSCEGMDLIAFLPISDVAGSRGVGMTDIWGWTDEVTGKEWVLLGRTDGTAFVDISNPNMPVYVGELLRTPGSPRSGWRDMKVYRDHAYIVADGAEAHGVQVFDLRQLRDVAPEEMPKTFEMTNHYPGTNSTHNIVINEETGFAYAVGNRSGGETCQGQLHMISLADPGNPTFAGCYGLADAGGTHDAQCVIYRGDDDDYRGREICFNSNGGTFIIADVTDKADPKTLAQTDYPNQAYTHQGWLTDDHNIFYMNDELDELNNLVSGTRTLIWDVSDLDDPVLAGEFTHDNKASDHNLYVRGNTMYQSNYQAGVRMLDISNPLEPRYIGHFDTVPFGEDEPGFGGSWSNYPYFDSGVIAISSRGEGLFLVKKQELDL